MTSLSIRDLKKKKVHISSDSEKTSCFCYTIFLILIITKITIIVILLKLYFVKCFLIDSIIILVAVSLLCQFQFVFIKHTLCEAKKRDSYSALLKETVLIGVK